METYYDGARILSESDSVPNPGIPEKFWEFGLGGLGICMGFFFTFFGAKYRNKILFCSAAMGCSYATWLLLQYVINEKFADSTVPHSTLGIISLCVGLIGGYLMLELLRTSLFLLGAAGGVFLGGLVWQAVSTWPSFQDKIGNQDLDRVAFLVFTGALGGFIMLYEIRIIFCVVTSFIGAYLITLGANDVWFAYKGKYISKLWLPDTLFGNPNAWVTTEEKHFWYLFNAWLVLFLVGTIVQYRREDNPAPERRRTSVRMSARGTQVVEGQNQQMEPPV